MNKKGQYALHELLLTIGELAIAGLVLAVFFLYIKSIESSAFLEKSYKARDLSLIIEALESSPGGIFYYYNDGRGFVYRFGKNRIDVYTKNERFDQPSLTYYFFPKNKNINFIYPQGLLIPAPFEENTQFALQKGFDFSINYEIDENVAFLYCPNISQKEKPIILRFDKEDDKEVSRLLQPKTVAITEESAKRALESDNSAIFIYWKYYDEEVVSIYISPNINSRALACSISNELRKKGIDSLIIPEDFEKEIAYLVLMMKREMKSEVASSLFNAIQK